MTDLFKRLTLAVAIGATTLAATAQEKPKTDTPATAKPAQKAPAPKESATAPKPRDEKWMKRHDDLLNQVKQKAGNVDLLMVGDSITDGWRGGGKQVFQKHYGSMDPLNIGIGGDRTQHVLWRLEHGEVEGISPKAAVLMIGTNNLGSNTDDEIAAGVTKIVHTLHEKLPKTKVLLLGIFPRSFKADDPARARIKTINQQIAKLDDGGKTVKYLDIGPKFLEADGTLPKSIMPDALHPNEKGYEIWAEAMGPTLEEMMK